MNTVKKSLRYAPRFVMYVSSAATLVVGLIAISEGMFGQHPLLHAYSYAMLGGSLVSASALAVGILRDNAWMIRIALAASVLCTYEASVPAINAAAQHIPGAYQLPSFFSLVFG